MRRLALPAVLVALMAAHGRAQGPDLRLVDELVQQSLRVWEVPGTCVVIVHNEQLLWLKGYGVNTINRREPVTAETLFPLASCSKTFTSAAIAHLVSQRRLSWDDPVRKHLPEFRLYDEQATQQATIRDLLSHRTGVGGHDFLWYRAPWPPAESIRRIAQMPPSGPFRSSFYYQSIMYMVLGEIVAKHHRDGWAGYVREHLLKPLGMTQTVLTYADAQKQTNVASAHKRNADGKVEACPWYTQNEPSAAGSVCVSATDLAKWLRFQLTGRSGSGRLMAQEFVDEMHKPHTVVPHEGFSRLLNPDTVQLSYAQAWLVQDYRGVRLVQHGGLIDGFRVHLTLLPDQKLAIGILSNLHDTRMPLALSNLLIDYLLQFPPKDWNRYYAALVQADQKAKEDAARAIEKQRNKAQKPSIPLEQFAGEYEHPAYGVCKLQIANRQLQWEWSSFKQPLEHHHGDVFQAKEPYLSDPLIEFKMHDGKAESLRLLEMDFKKK